MKIEITKEELKRVVAVCAPMVAHTSSTPIVECVLISASSDEAKMFAYDFTNSVSCNMDARIIAPGELVLPAKMLMDILSNVGDDIISCKVEMYMMIGFVFFTPVLLYFLQKEAVGHLFHDTPGKIAVFVALLLVVVVFFAGNHIAKPVKFRGNKD